MVKLKRRISFQADSKLFLINMVN